MKIEYRISNDSVEFELFARKPPGIEDDRRIIKIRPNINIPDLPVERPEDYQKTIIFWNPFLGKWIGFVFCCWRESSAGNEEELIGPYIIEGLEPPTEEQIANLRGDNALVSQEIQDYPIQR